MNVFWGLMIPFFGTTLGAACVFFMKKELNPLVQKGFLGFAAGVMSAAGVFSMLLPAMRQKAGGWLTVTLRAECLEEIGREVPLTDD